MKEIELTHGKTTIVDDKDFSLVADYKWCAQQNRQRHTCYALTHIKKNGKRTSLQMHQLILDIPEDMQADHIDHDGLNNRRCNLRFATNQQNSFNRKSNEHSSSRYKGVCQNKRRRKWMAQIMIDGKNKYLGYFANEEDAARTYNKAAERLFGDFAYLNKIDTNRE